MYQVGKLENKMQTFSYERTQTRCFQKTLYTERWKDITINIDIQKKLLSLCQIEKLNGCGMSQGNRVYFLL